MYGLDALTLTWIQNFGLFVFLTILWWIWDARNVEVFRSQPSSSQHIISRVCDDLVVWQNRLKVDHDVTNLRH
jgi:hypothetical protein